MFSRIIRAWRKYKLFLKEETEVSRAQRRLARMPLDYAALQSIADSVSSGYNVKITVQAKDAALVFERGSSQNDIGYVSFAERYGRYHNGDSN